MAKKKQARVEDDEAANHEAEAGKPQGGEPPPPQDNVIPVVGIGASAGGLAALKAFFSHVPEGSGLAYVIIVHLSPEHESHLAELLQPHINMPVQQVTETTRLEANRVYVIPPNANLDAIDTHLRLSELESRRGGRAPIDHFFRTLSKAHDGHGVGVVLTGTGSDGTLGLREIKEAGGLCIVQSPNEAEYDGMPQSAIATGIVDLILPLAEIPDAIAKFVHTRPRLPFPAENDEVDGELRQLLQKVFNQIKARTGRDFNRYKRTTILRRIQRRMQLLQIEDLKAYVALLRDRAEEIHTLADDLLITVTNFFRDPRVYDELATRVIPQLFAERSAEDAVRVWTVGCATGEEAYSIAMLLLEEAARRDDPPSIQIFASDLHEHSLSKGRDGFYPGDIEADVSPERLRRFFVRETGGYRIRKEVRELVVFAPHNLLGDPPFSRLDLVTCRNVLIYIQRDAQRDVIELFHYALRPDGFLILGTSETVEAGDLFRTEDKKACIYRKRNVPAPDPRLPVFPPARPRLANLQDEDASVPEPLAYTQVHQGLVQRFAPPSALVSPDDKFVHLTSGAGDFMVHPAGELTANIYKLIREELRVELRSALHEARGSGRLVSSKAIPVKFHGDRQAVVLHVQPSADRAHEGFALVVFELRDEGQPSQRSLPARDEATEVKNKKGRDARIEALEAELNLSNQQLQAIIEEYETSQEEMKAANEELQSTNEELRSTLEELETGKEELQSMNEELQTVNQENRHKVEELAQLSSDLQNLLAATDIATLFLDRQFRILRFTPKIAELFNILLTDRGRPISDLTHRLGYDALLDDAEAVLRRLTPIEREIQDSAGRWYLTRVMPYRSADDRIEGIVITFVEITRRKLAEESVKEADRRKTEFLATLAHELRNPLAPIRTGLEVLRINPADASTFDSVRGTIQRQTDQLVSLVDDLLDVSRITQGKLELKIRPTVLSEIVQTAVEAVQPLLKNASQALELDLPKESILIHGDPHRLAQVLANLLSNASKFSPAGNRVWLTATINHEDLLLTVRDQGRGIAVDKLTEVFEMFAQLENGEGNHGLGIGLTLAKQLVELHGGAIDVLSAGSGQGCEFRVRLPVTAEAMHVDGAEPTSSDLPTVAPLRVLVVDDNADAATTLARLLRIWGHSVETAQDGVAALEQAVKFKPELVLMDLSMPRMDGFEAARQMREQAWAKTAVLAALTGWGQNEDHAKIEKAGFDRYLLKPVEQTQLLELLASVKPA